MLAISQQPVASCFDARALQYYKSGVIGAENCSSDEVNYCGVLVGYTKNEWIVKASFGKEFGEDGYFRLAKEGNPCGIQNNVFFSQV